MARVISDPEIARILAMPSVPASDHCVSRYAMQVHLLHQLSLLDEQIDILSDELGADASITVAAMGWSDDQMPDQVRDSWSSLSYLLSAREAVASTLRYSYGLQA